MRRYFRPLLAAMAMITAAALMPVGVAVAEIDAQTLKRIKRATVFVSLGQQRGAGSGSGFLVHRDGQRGLVVTNAHVAAKAVAGGLRVVFNSGTRKADSIPATVLGLSRVRDLAVLEIQAPDLPEPLQISANAQVHETQTVHIVGFPFGKGFATNRETPVVTISRGTVSSQRMDVNDQTRLMQIDGDLNPGNSGGPIMDDSGQVVGVAVATIRQTNIGFAIPLAPLLEMLAGTLTDLQAEISSQGVRVSGQLLDPYGRFESAGLHLRAMHEDAVLDLLSDAEQWQPIAAEAPASAFVRRNDGSYAAVHALPENPPGGTSLVAQITVKANGAVRYLPPFRVEASGLSVSLSGPDVLADSEEDESAAQRAAKATSEEASKGGNKIAMASPLESDFDELFNRSGLSGLIASMGADGGSGFDEGTDSEDERTVKERLREIIAAHWDEARIKRTYVRSFEAAPNGDAQRRATELFDLPLMKLLHHTLDRLKPLSNNEVDALKKWQDRSPVTLEKRLDLMREIDRKRNFTRASIDELTVSISSLARLLNEIKPSNTRMSDDLLQRDIERIVAQLRLRVRNRIPVLLVNLYMGVDEKDLRDYLKQLDSIALRWFAERELESHTAVITAQFNEAEDEIVQLFKEVRRESLGLAEAPDLTGKSDVQAMDALIQAYGKEGVIDFVLTRRGGEINISNGGGVKSQFGRPAKDSVTAKTLVADLRAMNLDAKAFAAELAQALVDRAYKERRLTARGQRTRLLAALRERRRAKALSEKATRSSRRAQIAQERALRTEQRAQKRQCEKTCRTASSECSATQRRSDSLCRRSAPRSGKERSRILAQCAQQRKYQRDSCREQATQCRERC